MRGPFYILCATFTLALILPCSVTWSQDDPKHELILRDLTRIQADVSNFDRSGIELFDGRRIGWDQVLRASIDPPKQEKFNKYVTEIGLPVFRLKTRIDQGDWWGAGQIAEPMFERDLAEGNVFPDNESKMLACLATMQSRLRSNKRAQAVLPYLEAVSIHAKLPKSNDSKFKKLLGYESTIGLAPDLIPVWFDASTLQSSAAKLEEMFKYLDVTSEASPSPALIIYLASMSIELGETERVKQLIHILGTRNFHPDQSEEIAAWKIVLEARLVQKTGDQVRCQAILEKNAAAIIGLARPAAFFYLGLSKSKTHDKDLEKQRKKESDLSNPGKHAQLFPAMDRDLSKAALLLLRVPALYGESNPHLAAAAISQAATIAKIRGHVDEHEKLREQLFRRYPRTYHGSKAARLP